MIKGEVKFKVADGTTSTEYSGEIRKWDDNGLLLENVRFKKDSEKEGEFESVFVPWRLMRSAIEPDIERKLEMEM